MKLLYSLALHLYPRDFRRRFAREMQQVFETRLQRSPSKVRFLAATLLDLILTATQERFAAMTFARLGYASTFLALFFAASLTMMQAFVIPTASMDPTLQIGDHLIVNKLPYTPHRDEMIVFRYPEDPSQTFIKRVIGIPGDRVHIVDKQLFRNGQPLTEPYAQHADDYIDTYRDNFPRDPQVHVVAHAQEMLSKHVVNGEVVVPPGAYFVMGDNRDRSLDSRFFGFVPQANIVGRPWFIYWSYDAQSNGTRWDRTPLVVR